MSLNPEEKDKAKKAVVGFVTTAAVAVATKLITLLLETESVSQAISYLLTNYPFLFTALSAAVAGGYFAQKWTGKDC